MFCSRGMHVQNTFQLRTRTPGPAPHVWTRGAIRRSWRWHVDAVERNAQPAQGIRGCALCSCALPEQIYGWESWNSESPPKLAMISYNTQTTRLVCGTCLRWIRAVCFGEDDDLTFKLECAREAVETVLLGPG